MSARIRRYLLATTLVGVLGASAVAQAQTSPAATAGSTEPGSPAPGIQSQESAPNEPSGSGDIVVTGTLIRDPSIASSAPVQIVGKEEIRLRQANTAEEILRTLPGAVPSIGSAVNNGGAGSFYVDLRGLGNFRNVVLLDGNRIAPVKIGRASCRERV